VATISSVKPLLKALLVCTFVLLIFGSVGDSVGAAQSNIDSSIVTVQEEWPTDPVELEFFLDVLMVEQMEEYHIPGAAVAVVKDGELFSAKGYGLTDIKAGIPVAPKTTSFRIGSGSKLFTATAASACTVSRL